MSDIVERLRGRSIDYAVQEGGFTDDGILLREAADQIEQMLAALTELAAAAERDMKMNQGGDDHEDEPESSGGWWSVRTGRAIAAARAAIAKAEKP
jgi:hypothetical protein